ncbi:contact-dependent growth inhibition system immunity protein [Nocardia sp. NPDC058640]|uniref:contact-dependent growth inhibition system immunity protein n=1 Tax=Nocardia sp. NPDC058640 TaxID=3346571 RepID=UPI003650AFA0
MAGECAQNTIEEIDGAWPEPDQNATRMIRTVHGLRRIPIQSLEPEGLRVLATQRVSLLNVLPRVLDVLDRNPLASGDLYPGDLLVATLRLGGELNVQQRQQLRSIVDRLCRDESESVPQEVWDLGDAL